MKINKDLSNGQGMSYFLDSRNREDKDQVVYVDLFKKTVRTFNPPAKVDKLPQKPQRRVKLQLVDEEGDPVEEYRIFKDTDKFFGNLDNFSKYGKESRDNDIQTTYEERLYGEKRSALVLSKTIRLLSNMKVIYVCL
jgi:hypothetical protein